MDKEYDDYIENYPIIESKDSFNCKIMHISTEYSYSERNLVGLVTNCGQFAIIADRSIYDNDSVEYNISENVEIGYRVWKRKGSDTVYVDKGDREIGFVLWLDE